MSQCRFCRSALSRTFIDLGRQPLANSYLPPEVRGAMQSAEPRYPLHAKVCDDCLLVQVDHDVPAEAIFSDYAYFSSVSSSWVEHARNYANAMTARFGISSASLVMEIASNDGYLLRHFKAMGTPVLGIEPAANVAAVAEQAGVPTRVAFFNRETAAALAAEGRRADLIAANNVMAHVPDLNAFIGGFPLVLTPQGVLTVEFPHLLNLIEQVQFDTIYHEHYSYLSLHAAERIFASHGMRVFDVERLPTHGGSLRLYVCNDAARHTDCPGVSQVRALERAAGLDKPGGYAGFAPRAEAVRTALIAFLRQARADGKRVAAYGAAAKGNTLLNYCGIGTDLVPVAFDKSPHKQDRLLPGSRIPIRPPAEIGSLKPDYLLILPWNLRNEITVEQQQIRTWGGKFVTAIPSLDIF